MVTKESTMDDQFMFGGLRRPRAEFARRLSERLDQLDLEHPAARRTMRPVERVTAWAAMVLLAVGAFAVPAVRAGAQAFLDLFRVVNFASVAVEPAKIQEVLSKQDPGLPRLLGEQFEILKQPAPPQSVPTLDAASAAAGMRVRTPAWLPVGIEQQSIHVVGESAARVTASTEKLKRVMDAFGIDDITVPDSVDGQVATMHMPPIVQIRYGSEKRHIGLMQARQPEVAFPAGTDLSLLAEVALRVMGIERAEAHRFAQSVDWRTTLMVPVPVDVAHFRQVDVQGHPGLLIESTRHRENGNRGENPDGEGWALPETQIMWSSGDSIFVVVGNVRSAELFEVAQSVQ
jgi:hypothetical protein